MSSVTFADLGVSPGVSAALERRGITSPFAIQSLVIARRARRPRRARQVPHRLGQDARLRRRRSSSASTASDPRPAALVLAPTRELATQIVEEWRAVAHAARASRRRRLRRRRHPRAGQATPRARTSSSPRPAASRTCSPAAPSRSTHVRMLVLDEADRMLDMGFRPADRPHRRACPRKRQTLFFSATLDGEAGRIAGAYTTRRRRARARGRRAAHRRRRAPLRAVEREDALDALIDELRGRPRARARLRAHQARRRPARQAPRRARRRAPSRCTATSRQRQREQALARFESGKVDMLVATDVAARGIDVARHLARHQLRPAGGPRGLRAPHRPHGPRRAPPASASRSSAPSRRATSARSPATCACSEQFARSGHAVEGPSRDGRG